MQKTRLQANKHTEQVDMKQGKSEQEGFVRR